LTYNRAELIHQIKNTTAKAILAHPKMLPLILPAADEAGVSRDRIFQFSDETNPVRQGVKDWRDMIGTQNEGSGWKWPILDAQAAAETVATINYSSGTTGLPKGVCVSHYNLAANVEQSIFMRYIAHRPWPFESRPKERWIGFLPLYHAYGQLYTILMAVKLNVSVYIMT
jgi:4-coumarate--CoA ligase